MLNFLGGTEHWQMQQSSWLFHWFKTRQGLNIVITLGGGGFSQALQDAIERANAGILFIAAAGNSGTDNDATTELPSKLP
jgi:subtilisin family serine protease